MNSRSVIIIMAAACGLTWILACMTFTRPFIESTSEWTSIFFIEKFAYSFIYDKKKHFLPSFFIDFNRPVQKKHKNTVKGRGSSLKWQEIQRNEWILCISWVNYRVHVLYRPLWNALSTQLLRLENAFHFSFINSREFVGILTNFSSTTKISPEVNERFLFTLALVQAWIDSLQTWLKYSRHMRKKLRNRSSNTTVSNCCYHSPCSVEDHFRELKHRRFWATEVNRKSKLLLFDFTRFIQKVKL